MFVVIVMVFVPLSVVLPTTSLVSIFTTSTSPWTIGWPVVLSVTVASIVVFRIVLLVMFAVVVDSLCVTVKV